MSLLCRKEAQRVSKRKGGRPVSRLSPTQLMRKRANDREAQRAKRQRDQRYVENLQRENAMLKEATEQILWSDLSFGVETDDSGARIFVAPNSLTDSTSSDIVSSIARQHCGTAVINPSAPNDIWNLGIGVPVVTPMESLGARVWDDAQYLVTISQTGLPYLNYPSTMEIKAQGCSCNNPNARTQLNGFPIPEYPEWPKYHIQNTHGRSLPWVSSRKEGPRTRPVPLSYNVIGYK